MRNAQLEFICIVNYATPRFRRNKQFQLLISTITMFATILLNLLSAKIKQRKVANLERKQSHRN